MNKTLLILIISITFFNCDKNKINKLESEVDKLSRKNDSLETLIKSKFVFDNADIRIIPSINNSKKIDSEFKGEIVVVGYNKSDIAILGDEWNYINPSFKNSDTIKNKRGAYSFTLNRFKNDTTHFYVKIDKKYGSRGYDSIITFPYNSFWKLK